MKRIAFIWILLFCCITAYDTQAQSAYIPEIQHPRNAAVRNAIEERKSGWSSLGAATLPLARELKRMDSLYYVPWMIEGVYLKQNAADYIGFNNAIASLRKAFDLLEKDYKKYLKTRTGDIFVYYPLYNLHYEFSVIAHHLTDCYSYTNRPDSAFRIASRFGAYNLQYEGAFGSFDTKAWLVHRNRFYTSEKFGFLKNTIAENEALANTYLDSAMMKIRKDKPLNANFLQPGYETYLKYSVYHYKAILYGYSLQIDSALHYYELMRNTPYFSNNNYGNLQMIRGNFQSGFENYQAAQKEFNQEKQLQEWAYYSSMLLVYKNDIPRAAEMMRTMIKEVGSTPGYGWYNIALTRALNYGGNTEDAGTYLKKAANFKDVHIGTTLGQTHYDFSIALITYHELKNQLKWIRFSDKGWWYKPSGLFKAARYWFKSIIQKYKIILHLKDNPEREQVVYKLFSTENTVAWDEILMGLDGLSHNYFLKYYKEQEQEDPRNTIHAYFKYVQASLHYKKGNYDEALKLVEELNALGIDNDFEKLFRARILELTINIRKAGGTEEKDLAADIVAFYTAYPQLFPFSGFRLPVYLQGGTDELREALAAYQIEWLPAPSEDAPSVVLTTGQDKSVKVTVNAPGLQHATTDIPWGKDTTTGQVAASVVKALFHIYQLPE